MRQKVAAASDAGGGLTVAVAQIQLRHDAALPLVPELHHTLRHAMLRIMHGRKPHGGDFGGPLRLALVRNVEPENRWATVAQAAQRPTFL